MFGKKIVYYIIYQIYRISPPEIYIYIYINPYSTRLIRLYHTICFINQVYASIVYNKYIYIYIYSYTTALHLPTNALNTTHQNTLPSKLSHFDINSGIFLHIHLTNIHISFLLLCQNACYRITND